MTRSISERCIDAYDVIDWRLIRPAAASCVDFQSVEAGVKGVEFQNDGVKFVIPEDRKKAGQLTVIQRPAPPGAHPWVPNPLHLLEVGEPADWLYVEFDEPVQWVELSAGAGPKVLGHPGDLFVSFNNSAGASAPAVTKISGYAIESVSFGSNDDVWVGGSEPFQPPGKVQAAGDIARLTIYAPHNEILIWRVCFWPQPSPE